MHITYIKGGKEFLKEVKPLWEALNVHHQNNAVNFLDQIQSNTFESRHKKFENNDLDVLVELVKCDEKEAPIAYLICTITKESMGEIDSIYVDKTYRKHAIGDQLMNDAMEWFRLKNTKTNRLKVAEGNEHVLKFYEKHGFETRFYVLEEVKR